VYVVVVCSQKRIWSLAVFVGTGEVKGNGSKFLSLKYLSSYDRITLILQNIRRREINNNINNNCKWNLKAKVIPIKIGASGTISKSHRREQRTGKSIKLWNCKLSHIRHCKHTAGSADLKVHNIFHGRNNTMFNP